MSYLFNVGSQRYLDIYEKGINPGTKIDVWTLNDPPTWNQKWFRIQKSDSALIRLYCQNGDTKFYLRVDEDGRTVTASSEGIAAQFTIETKHGNTIFLYGENSALTSGQGTGSQLFIDLKAETNYQRWVIQREGKSGLEVIGEIPSGSAED